MTDPVVLDFTAKRKPPLVLKVPEGEFELDTNLWTEEVGEMVMAEEALNRLKAHGMSKPGDDDELSPQQAATEVKKALDFVNFKIRQSTPDAPKVRLTVEELMQILPALIDNDSVSQEVMEALAAIAADEDLQAALERAQEAGVGEDGEESGAPLAGRKRSRSRSSGSTKKSRSRSSGASSARSGSRTTGSGSAGTSSKPSTPTPETA